MSGNIFGKAFNGLFRPGSPIPDEPTIDYNDTIYSYRTNPASDYTKRSNISKYSTSAPITPRTPSRFSSRYVFDDSDDELNEDMSYVYNQFNENSTKLSNVAPDYEVPGAFNSYDKVEPESRDRLGMQVPDRFNLRNTETPGDRFVRNKDVFASRSKLDDIGYNRDRDLRSSYKERLPERYKTADELSSKYQRSEIPSRFAERTTNTPKRFPKDDTEYRRYGTDLPSYSTRPHSQPDPVPTYDRGRYHSTYGRGLSVGESVPEIRGTTKDRYDTIYNGGRQKKDQAYTIPDRFAGTRVPNKKYGSEKDISIYEDRLASQNSAKEVIKLEQELNKESVTKLNTKYNELSNKLQEFKKLNALNEDVKQNNKVLRELNELVEIHNDSDIKMTDKNYENLRLEYLNELKSHQFFYQNYIKLFDRYKSVKESKRNDGNKIRAIRDSCKDEHIRKLCDEILSE